MRRGRDSGARPVGRSDEGRSRASPRGRRSKRLSWFVVHCRPGKDALVAEEFRRLGREVFLPLIAARGSPRCSPSLRPLFPGYIFVRTSPSSEELARLRWIRGVKWILGDREPPIPIEDEVVRGLRASADPRGRIAFGRGLTRRSRIRVMEGPLAGLIGVLESNPEDAGARVRILLSAFGRSISAEIPARSALRLPER